MPAMPITAFLGNENFDAETKRAMGVAFERACQTLGLIDKTDPATRLLAEKVIDAAKAGERDVETLYNTALASARGPPDPPGRRDAA